MMKKAANHSTKQLSLSVVIPAHNSKKTIKKCLESVVNAIPKNKEIIVIDDGSTDNTSEIAKKFKEVRLIRREKNSGCAAIPINAGIDAAKNEIVAIMNADSYPEKDALLYMVHYFKDKKTGAGARAGARARDCAATAVAVAASVGPVCPTESNPRSRPLSSPGRDSCAFRTAFPL